MVGESKTVRKGHEMTNRKMFFTMLWGAVFRRRSRAVMAVIASMVGAATLFCLAATCIAVPQQMNEEMRAYGANLIVTPSESAEKSHGIDTDTVKALNQMVKVHTAPVPPPTGMKACASTRRHTRWPVSQPKT